MTEKQSIASLRKSEGRGKFLITLLVFTVVLLLLTTPEEIQIATKFHLLKLLHDNVLVGSSLLWGLASTIIWPTIVIGIWRWKRIAICASFLFFGVSIILNGMLFLSLSHLIHISLLAVLEVYGVPSTWRLK